MGGEEEGGEKQRYTSTPLLLWKKKKRKKKKKKLRWMANCGAGLKKTKRNDQHPLSLVIPFFPLKPF